MQSIADEGLLTWTNLLGGFFGGERQLSWAANWSLASLGKNPHKFLSKDTWNYPGKRPQTVCVRGLEVQQQKV